MIGTYISIYIERELDTEREKKKHVIVREGEVGSIYRVDVNILFGCVTAATGVQALSFAKCSLNFML